MTYPKLGEIVFLTDGCGDPLVSEGFYHLATEIRFDDQWRGKGVHYVRDTGLTATEAVAMADMWIRNKQRVAPGGNIRSDRESGVGACMKCEKHGCELTPLFTSRRTLAGTSTTQWWAPMQTAHQLTTWTCHCASHTSIGAPVLCKTGGHG